MTLTPINVLEIEPDTAPTPEQLQLLASDYITRVLALMQQKQPRKALVRVTQLNALVQEFPLLTKAYPGLPVFIRYGAHFCSGTKVKATAIFFLCQKAAPILQRMTAAVQEYIAEQKFQAQEAAAVSQAAPKPVQKLERLGNSLAALQTIMPRVVDENRLRLAAEEERRTGRTETKVINENDEFILEQANKSRTHALSSNESGVVRIALVLTDAYVSKVAQKALCVEYGLHKVMGTYWIMTAARLIGVARKDEYGATRPEADVLAHAEQLLINRNKAQAKKNLPALVFVGPSATTGAHRYFLTFDSGYVTDAQVHIKRWSFFKTPGTADIELAATLEAP